MNYATTVDPDLLCVCFMIRVYTAPELRVQILSAKKMYAHADLELQILHILLNPVFYYLERLLLFLCWVLSKYG